jgi:hypothetical protein
MVKIKNHYAGLLTNLKAVLILMVLSNRCDRDQRREFEQMGEAVPAVRRRRIAETAGC